MCFSLSKLQAPFQAALRPGVWIPGIRALHQRYESWQTDISPFNCFDEVLQALNTLELTEKIEVYKADKDHLSVQAFFYTKSCNWLDVVEFEFQAAPEAGTLVKARSFSSGFLPVCVPLCFVFNVICCFVPFYDLGENKSRLERIRETANVAFTLVEWGKDHQPA